MDKKVKKTGVNCNLEALCFRGLDYVDIRTVRTVRVGLNRMWQAFRIASSLVRYKIGSPKPFFVSYQITLRCNRRCVFCNAWKLETHTELDTQQAKKVVGELGNFGIGALGITGGEPLIRRDLEEIAACARRKGLIVGVNTNGTLLTPRRAESISRTFDAVFLSLDGFERTHDGIRGENGTFREALAGLKNIVALKSDCTVGVNFVLSNVNYREFIPFCKWLRNLGVLVTFFPVGGEDAFIQDYSIPCEDVDSFVCDVLEEKTTNPLLGPSKKVIELIPKFVRGEMPQICDAGRLYLGVSPTGELRICPIGPNSPEWQIGSLVTSSLTDLLSSNRYYKVLEGRKHCTPCLAGCTTPYSLLFRCSAKDLTKEALSYCRAFLRAV